MESNDQPGGVTLSLGHSTFIPDEEKKRGAVWLGFVLGLLCGVIATLLLSPKTGEETREQVKEMTIVLKERALGMMTGERPYEPNEGGPNTTPL